MTDRCHYCRQVQPTETPCWTCGKPKTKSEAEALRPIETAAVQADTDPVEGDWLARAINYRVPWLR